MSSPVAELNRQQSGRRAAVVPAAEGEQPDHKTTPSIFGGFFFFLGRIPIFHHKIVLYEKNNQRMTLT